MRMQYGGEIAGAGNGAPINVDGFNYAGANYRGMGYNGGYDALSSGLMSGPYGGRGGMMGPMRGGIGGMDMGGMGMGGMGMGNSWSQSGLPPLLRPQSNNDHKCSIIFFHTCLECLTLLFILCTFFILFFIRY